jgi:hypothetical protein
MKGVFLASLAISLVCFVFGAPSDSLVGLSLLSNGSFAFVTLDPLSNTITPINVRIPQTAKPGQQPWTATTHNGIYYASYQPYGGATNVVAIDISSGNIVAKAVQVRVSIFSMFAYYAPLNVIATIVSVDIWGPAQLFSIDPMTLNTTLVKTLPNSNVPFSGTPGCYDSKRGILYSVLHDSSLLDSYLVGVSVATGQITSSALLPEDYFLFRTISYDPEKDRFICIWTQKFGTWYQMSTIDPTTLKMNLISTNLISSTSYYPNSVALSMVTRQLYVVFDAVGPMGKSQLVVLNIDSGEVVQAGRDLTTDVTNLCVL